MGRSKILPIFLYIYSKNSLNPKTLNLMDARKRRIVIAVMLMLSIGNYFRIVGNENIRTIQFLSIFAIGALSALLIRSIAEEFKNK